MTYGRAMRILAYFAILPAGVSFWFFLFWGRFEFWRKHRVFTYAMIAAVFALTGVVVYASRGTWLRWHVSMPTGVRIVGWVLIGVATVFGWIADRQIGFRVRSFAPFFDEHGHIELKTSGAFGVVRHPIYVAGRIFTLGAFLVTGYVAVLLAYAVFGLGSVWFSRREEEQLVKLLDDPESYERYRARVPALFPRIIPRRPSA
jgi:protein-S-isoprenylcysteine O-methyltransferase Ste14